MSNPDFVDYAVHSVNTDLQRALREIVDDYSLLLALENNAQFPAWQQRHRQFWERAQQIIVDPDLVRAAGPSDWRSAQRVALELAKRVVAERLGDAIRESGIKQDVTLYTPTHPCGAGEVWPLIGAINKVVRGFNPRAHYPPVFNP